MDKLEIIKQIEFDSNSFHLVTGSLRRYVESLELDNRLSVARLHRNQYWLDYIMEYYDLDIDMIKILFIGFYNSYSYNDWDVRFNIEHIKYDLSGDMLLDFNNLVNCYNFA